MKTRVRTKAIAAAVLSGLLLLAPAQTYAVKSKQAQYDGGTITQIPKAAKGKLVVDDTNLRFE